MAVTGRFCLIALVFALLVNTARGDYLLSLLSDSALGVTVNPGEMGQVFDLDVLLNADAADTHNSAIVRLVFTAPGLELIDYSWGSPYETGTVWDDTTPHWSELGGGVALDADTLSGTGYPGGVVDIELSNVVPLGEPYFGDGTLATLSLFVPPSISVPQTVTISAEVDAISHGFDAVGTTVGNSFDLIIVPEPGGCAMILVTALAVSRRRRVCRRESSSESERSLGR